MKKYDLDRSMFISASVFFSIIFLPMIAMCVIGLCIEFVWGILVTAVGFFAVYAALMIYFWFSSHKHTNYLLLHDEKMEIMYTDASNSKTKHMYLQYGQIRRIEYYRLHSLLSWLQMVANYIFPMCVFVTYVSDADGEEYSANIGYLRLYEVKQIAKQTGLDVKYR
ncbi:MAG: hypothetical protein IJW70_06740 [Clostridia bacterium]|nr:hypothetical protein [Clostridia bacterium]